MRLEELWEKYSPTSQLNYSALPEEIRNRGTVLHYNPNEIVMNRGDFPAYIYFIISGVAFGSRNYNDGNNYFYFTMNHSNGCPGLLEILAHKSKIIATVVAATDLTVLKIDSAIIYEYLMTNIEMLYNCTFTVAEDLYKSSGNSGLLYYQQGIDRVRYYLVQYYLLNYETSSDPLVVKPDYQTIASNIGISVRTVVRSIQKLKQLGEVSSCKRKITISAQQYARSMAVIQPLLYT